MFDAFTLEEVDVGEVRLRVRFGGDGPPVVLLHGHPRTHTTWHRVAPLLAGSHFVVCPDLRGYGRSTLPADATGHAQSCKRAMANDVVETFVRAWWHWWFLTPADKPAERVINFDPEAWYGLPSPSEMGEENHADITAALHDPGVVHGMCEDYRAGLGVDRQHEIDDRAAGRRVACPTLLMVATMDDIDVHGDPVAIWRPWVAGELRSVEIPSGHHQAEQAPAEVAQALLEFLSAVTH